MTLHHPVPEAALPAWRTLAALLTENTCPCQLHPDGWFAATTAERREAAQACQLCPSRVHAACAQYAAAAGERFGVWGGRDLQQDRQENTA